MFKTVVLLLTGAVISGLATHVALDRDRSDAGPAASIGPEPIAEGADTDAAGAVLPESSTSASASSSAPLDPDFLESLIAEANAEPSSYMRDFELKAWLAELAATDPARAARLALSLGLPERFLESVFKLWAEADPDAALAEIAGLVEPRRHAIALAATDVLGADPASIERIVGVLDTDVLSFQLGALTRFSEHNPSLAFEIANDLIDPRTRSLAFQDMGAIWGGQDPEAALAAAESAPAPGPGPIFFQRVFQAWSRLDVQGFLAYAAQSSHPNLSSGFAEAAMGDPVLALRAAETLPDEQRIALTSQDLRVLASRDPLAAVAHVAAVPIGGERDQRLRAIASSGRVTIADGQPIVIQ